MLFLNDRNRYQVVYVIMSLSEQPAGYGIRSGVSGFLHLFVVGSQRSTWGRLGSWPWAMGMPTLPVVVDLRIRCKVSRRCFDQVVLEMWILETGCVRESKCWLHLVGAAVTMLAEDDAGGARISVPQGPFGLRGPTLGA